METEMSGLSFFQFKQKREIENEILLEKGKLSEEEGRLAHLNSRYKSLVNEYEYQRGSKLLNDGIYDEAFRILATLKGYKDSSTKLDEYKYQRASKLLGEGAYDEASLMLASLEDYKDSKAKLDELKANDKLNEYNYRRANELLEEHKYDEAGVVFAGLGFYKDSFEKRILYYNPLEACFSVSTETPSIGLRKDGTVVIEHDQNYENEEEVYSLVESWSGIVAVSSASYRVVGVKKDGTVVAALPHKSIETAEEDERDLDIYRRNIYIDLSQITILHGHLTDYNKHLSEWRDIVSVELCDEKTIGLKKNGTAIGYGNPDKYFDRNDHVYVNIEETIQEWSDIVVISASDTHVLGLEKDGTVVATSPGLFVESCDVSEWRDIVAIAAGYGFSVGLKSDGTVTTVGKYFPHVYELRDIIAVKAVDDVIVALKKDGTVFAVERDRVPDCQFNSLLSKWKDIVAISTGYYSIAGLRKDGTVVAVSNAHSSTIESIECSYLTDIGTSFLEIEKQEKIGEIRDLWEVRTWDALSKITNIISQLSKLDKQYYDFSKNAYFVREYTKYNKTNVPFLKYGAVNQEWSNILTGKESQYPDNDFDSLFNCYHAPETLQQLLFCKESNGNNDIQKIFMYIWLYAARTPHDAQRFSRAVELYQRVAGIKFEKNGQSVEPLCLDCLLAKAYSLMKIGEGNIDLMRDTFYEWIDYFIEKKDDVALSNLASGLAWLKAEKYERELLEKMLTSGVSMSEALQDRLKKLQKKPVSAAEYKGPKPKSADSHRILNDKSVLAFDNEPVNWSTDKFTEFFDYLASQNATLLYALVMNEPWKPGSPVVLPRGFEWSNEAAFDDIAREIGGEFGSSVVCEKKTAAVLLSAEHDEIDGMLITPVKAETGFDYVGLFVSIFRIGQSLDIQIYTLYLPQGDVAVDKRQALSLNQNANPRHGAFINALRDAVVRVLADRGNAQKDIYD
jgi:hypothetical protein